MATDEIEIDLENGVNFYGLCREDGGWSLYRVELPRAWLQDAERMRDGDSLASVLVHQRLACLRDAG